MPQFHLERLDGAGRNGNPGSAAVSRETSYEGRRKVCRQDAASP
jgi:hypothetical protein